MNKNVVVIVSDKNYFNHAKSLIINLRKDCNYNGDICLITNENDIEDFENHNIIVKKYDVKDPFFMKFYIFDSYFKKWEKVLYLDCDIMFFEDINDVFSSKNDLNGDVEPWSIYGHKDGRCFSNKDMNLLNELLITYDIDNYPMYNTGCLLYNTKIVDDNTVKELFELQQKFDSINIHNREHGTDQPIINILFRKIFQQFDSNFIAYEGTQKNTKGYHFCKWRAPWIWNRPSRFGMTYVQKYNENLKKWNENK